MAAPSSTGVDARVAVLVVGEDAYLLRTRQMVLEREGYVVTSVSANDVLRMSPAHVDLAVLCHTLTEAARRRVVAYIRSRSPHVRIVVIDRLQRQWSRTEADLSVSSPDPQNLLESIRNFL